MAVNQGLVAAKRVLPIVDIVNEIENKPNATDLKINKGNINFVNVNFKYNLKEKIVLKSGNLNIEG